MKTNKTLSWYRETYIRDQYECFYCDRDLKSSFYDWMSIQIDHIIPVSKGGSDDLSNRVTSCNVCNAMKHSYLPKNHESLSQKELLDDIRSFIKDKRDKWEIKYQKALIEYAKVKEKNSLI